MNVRFMHPEKFENVPLLDPHWVESDEEITPTYLEQDVENLFFNTEFSKLTGMSYLEVRQLDLPTYRRLSERMVKQSKEKIKQLESMRRETEAHTRNN